MSAQRKRKETAKTNRADETVDQVLVEISPRSRGGRSLFEAGPITPENVDAFHSDPSVVNDLAQRLRRLGAEVLQSGRITVTARMSQKRFEEIFDQRLKAATLNQFGKEWRIEAPATYFVLESNERGAVIEPPKQLADVMEGAVLPIPHEFMQSPLPPPAGYHHLDVPGDVGMLLNADRVHQKCVTGCGIRIAMVDSGHFAHPFFASRGYRVEPVVLSPDSAGTDPTTDDNGHGTMESANFFATAPKATLVPVKTRLLDTAAAVQAAVDQNPNIISCSWGRSLPTPPFNSLPPEELPLAAIIAEAVRLGIVVCFSAGNGHIGWPAMSPHVIAVGGCYAREDSSLRASDYASSFTTPIFPNRRVPDVCGLVGLLPRGIYIMLPGQANSQIDAALAGGAFPNGDETQPDDGWACISGTSASCPQIAGVCALLLEACGGLSPAEVRQILMTTARDVIEGSTNPVANQPPGPHTAVPGPDLATGAGFVDAAGAVDKALCRSGKEESGDCGCRAKKPKPKEVAYEYAVKFVCGNSHHDVAAHGEYFTAINIRNPSARRARFNTSFAVALPGRPGPVWKAGSTVLGPGEATEIDCPQIAQHTRTTPGCFVKGFAEIVSPTELDVVAVYTAAKEDRRIETLDIEKITPRVIEQTGELPEEPPDGREPDGKLPDLIPVPPFPPGPPFFPSGYCKSRAELQVIVRNQGAGDAGPTTTRVDFLGIGPVSKPTPAIPAGGQTLLSFDIPRGCFSPESCDFRITVNANPGDGVDESDTTNNTDQSNCVVLL
jgi:hypothetical protein